MTAIDIDIWSCKKPGRAPLSMALSLCAWNIPVHDDVIKWKHFLRYWPFVWVIHRSPMNSPHKGQLCGALMFSLICAWTNGCVNNRDAGDLRRHRSHYDVTVMMNRTSLRQISKVSLLHHRSIWKHNDYITIHEYTVWSVHFQRPIKIYMRSSILKRNWFFILCWIDCHYLWNYIVALISQVFSLISSSAFSFCTEAVHLGW